MQLSILRRRLLLGACALCVPLSVRGQVSSSQWGRAIYEIFDTVDEFLDWVNWAEDAVTSTATRKPLPPPPGSLGSNFDIAGRIASVHSKVNAIAAPTFSAALPPASGINFEDRHAAREALRNRIQLLSQAVAEVLTAIPTLKMLDNLKLKLGVMRRNLDVLKDGLRRVAESGLDFTHQFGFEYIAIEWTYIRALANMVSDLDKRKWVVKTAIDARIFNVRTSAASVLALLGQESQALTAETTRLKEQRDAILKRDEALTRRRAALDERWDRHRDLQAELSDIDGRLDEAQSRRSGWAKEQVFQEKIERWWLYESQAEWRCPIARVTWNECVDASHVIYKDEFIKKYHEGLAETRKKIAEASRHQNALGAEIGELNSQRHAKSEQIRGSETTLRRAEDEFNATKNQLNTDKQMALWDEWRSRAVAYMEEGVSNRSAIERLLERLSR